MVSYQIEKRTKEKEEAWITQCYIYMKNSKKHKFELILSFLADINTKGGEPKIFNRVFINNEGIFYLIKK